MSEAGWALYHRAHLQWLHDQGANPPDVIVWTLPDRIRFYANGLAKFVRTDLPKSLLSPFLVRNNWGWNGGPNFDDILKECGIEYNTLLHGFKDVQRYNNKMTFKPFTIYDFEKANYDILMSSLDRSKENIVLFPRAKYGAECTEFRNWGQDRWNTLYTMLLDKLPDYNIIIAGKLGQVYKLGTVKGRTIEIINDSPLDEILWVLNDTNTVLTVSSQSFNGKLALLQNKNTLMWGHEQARHQEYENWSSDPNTKCTFIEDMQYSIPPEVIFNVIWDLV